MRDVPCERCAELSTEVALGVAEAEERAAVLAHVEQCPACRAELQSMGELADALVGLVPASSPPMGFESRVVASVADSRRRSRKRRASRGVLAAAAAVLAALFAGAGWLVGAGTPHSSHPASPQVQTAALLAGGRPIGEVVVVKGAAPWLSMAVYGGDSGAQVRCEVKAPNGAVTTVGKFWLADGHGYWADSLPPGLTVRSAQLVLPNGRVLASATIAPRA